MMSRIFFVLKEKQPLYTSQVFSHILGHTSHIPYKTYRSSNFVHLFFSITRCVVDLSIDHLDSHSKTYLVYKEIKHEMAIFEPPLLTQLF